MGESANNLSCGEFQAQLPDLIGSSADFANHPHLHNCSLCRALLADLETIAQAARRQFPIEEPPTALWKHIKFAIVIEEAVDFEKRTMNRNSG